MASTSAPSRAPVRRQVRLRAEHPARRIDVRSESDIIRSIIQARETGATVRALGADGSKNDCRHTSGVAFRMTGYDRLLAVDGNLVTVEAGMSVGQLNRILHWHGLAIPTHGEWAGATVGGALATGTHGGSLRHGIFATSVHAFRFIDADGAPRVVTRDSPLFRHAGLSLGTFGVMSTVTFACEDDFFLELAVHARRFRSYLYELPDMMRGNEFCAAVWIPTAQYVVSHLGRRVAGSSWPDAYRPVRFGAKMFGLGWASRVLHLRPFRPGWFESRTTGSAGSMVTPINDGSNLTKAYRVISRSWMAAEFAIPVCDAQGTLEELELLLDRYRAALTHPVGLRPGAADGFSLSPASGRPVFWIDIFYRDHDGFAAALREFFEARNARCHWGKHIGLSVAHLQGQYAGFEDFRAARMNFDPEGFFMNRFARRLGL